MKLPLFVYKVPGKNFMLAFESEKGEERETQILNAAILNVMKGRQLQPFHQIGVDYDGANKVGFHGWETWRTVTEEDMNALIPVVMAKAQELQEWW